MKKSIALVFVILIAIAILPTIGNSIIKKNIDEKLSEIKNVGVEVKADKIDSAYLHTSRHFEFLVNDSEKLFQYFRINLNQINLNKNLDGMLIGVDVAYNNLPFSKAVQIEIYPLKMSENMQTSLKKEDIRVYRYLETFLSLKKLLLHVNYKILNNQYDGYLKDIDEKFNFKNGSIAKVKILKLSFDGKNKKDKSNI